MNEKELRAIIREEIRRVLTETAKKGDRVRTPHGTGEVLSIQSNQCRVKLDGGAVVKVHRDRCVVMN